MVKEGFDIVFLNDEEIKVYLDCDILDILSKKGNDDFILGKNSVKVSGSVNSFEIEELKKYHKNIFISEIKHAYFLDQKGFYGAVGSGGKTIEDDEYFIECFLSDSESRYFLSNHIIPFLKDIRLNELTN
jgi:hypothetical protein